MFGGIVENLSSIPTDVPRKSSRWRRNSLLEIATLCRWVLDHNPPVFPSASPPVSNYHSFTGLLSTLFHVLLHGNSVTTIWESPCDGGKGFPGAWVYDLAIVIRKYVPCIDVRSMPDWGL